MSIETVTDIFSDWTENVAMWNKGVYGAKEQIKAIEERLPFISKSPVQ